ncbi:putative ribosome biogenesis protein Ssf2 [Saccharata proteae CBS 121410]|uniref:Ribosome biogenesis protein Ssf2 n=1 Tax=Saccharata proteae CBS 121410 TaxID=1314787 RepID=A0A9P4HRI5_9PEZI|nr:putative ribosome biogenesis protein Ssf2 [Saccharata proteae CBS 121410]
MAKRRVKKRTHAGAKDAAPGTGASAQNPMARTPKSMVIRVGAGEVGSSVTQLVKDVRHVMEPGTATRLKERRSNKLRDYTTMAGPLGVSDLLLFSKSATGNTNLRIAKTPRGPTLHFRVEKYSLMKDVMKAQKHPRTGGHEYLTAPLLVMNNFTTPADAATTNNSIPKNLETLTTTMFQSLFPPINPQANPLSSIRRVLLLNREPAPADSPNAYVINLRHYAITTRTAKTGVPKGIRRLNAADKLAKSKDRQRKGLPNLGKLEDVADYLLDPDAAGGGYTSASETEGETDAEVEVLADTARKVIGRKEKQRREASGKGAAVGGGRSNVERRAVKLIELGPRMKLRLNKVEEGLCGGKVLWHESITKTKEEEREMDRTWEKRRKEKEERRRIQKENVERKKKEKGEKGGDEEEDEEDWDEDMDDDAWDSEGLDDEGAGDVQGEGGDDDEEMEDDDG